MKNADIDFSVEDIKKLPRSTHAAVKRTGGSSPPRPAVPGPHTVRDAGTNTLATAYSESGEFGGTRTEP
jgi:hypothetical protein